MPFILLWDHIPTKKQSTPNIFIRSIYATFVGKKSKIQWALNFGDIQLDDSPVWQWISSAPKL